MKEKEQIKERAPIFPRLKPRQFHIRPLTKAPQTLNETKPEPLADW